MVARAWVNRTARFATLSAMRDYTELLVDPYSGELYYLLLATGMSLAFPMTLLGAVYLLHPFPDWRMAVAFAPDGTPRYAYHRVRPPPWHAVAVVEQAAREKRAKDAAIAAALATKRFGGTAHGSLSSAASLRDSSVRSGVDTESVGGGGGGGAVPSLVSPGRNTVTGVWVPPAESAVAAATAAAAVIEDDATELSLPPPGYVMCGACGVDFARRECHGAGCDGYAYCWSCFKAYHPADDAAWASHWEVGAWRHVCVKPGGVPTPAEVSLMAAHKPRRVRRATRSGWLAAAAAGSVGGSEDEGPPVADGGGGGGGGGGGRESKAHGSRTESTSGSAGMSPVAGGGGSLRASTLSSSKPGTAKMAKASKYLGKSLRNGRRASWEQDSEDSGDDTPRSGGGGARSSRGGGSSVGSSVGTPARGGAGGLAR